MLTVAGAAAPVANAAKIAVCVKKKTGTVLFITGKAKCKTGESSVSWNTVGSGGATAATELTATTTRPDAIRYKRH